MRAGADRIELCAALPEGGTTPSYGMVRQVLQSVTIPVFPIIRPRGGDFLYTDAEVEVMHDDILALKALGVQGFSLGLLTPDGRLDRAATTYLLEACGDLPVTLHRAFDRSADLLQELEVAIQLGFQRILTSGGAISAPEGVEMLSMLVEQAGDRITIMAGAGIRPSNVQQLVHDTRVREVHGTFSAWQESGMQYHTPHFPDEYSEPIGEYNYKESDEATICALLSQLNEL